PGAHKKIRGVSPRDCPRASGPLRSACAERRDRARCRNGKRFLDTAGNDKRIAAGYFPLSKPLACGILRGFFSPEALMAYAIIKTGGRQYRIAEGDTIDVDLL